MESRQIYFQILNKSVCVPNRVNNLEIRLNLTILSTAMGKIVGNDGLFKLSMTTSLEEGKF